MPFALGLERLESGDVQTTPWGRCGLVSNQASLTHDFKPAWQVLTEKLQGKAKLTALFGPQHGFASTVQENMIETGHAKHRPTGLPVYSLYSEIREPSPEMLKNVDTLVVDLAITGCRIYTYKYTLAACLRAAKKHKKHVVVLDRPNPLGGEIIEGNVLEMDATSFVGEFPLPMRHGLTMAEAAQFFNASIGADLEVVPMRDWSAQKYWHELGREWIITSPNMPNIEACYVFPGMVLFEGTNVSEGRGTTLPFLFMGAPFIRDETALLARIKEWMPYLEGVVLRETVFMPTCSKWPNKECHGFQIHVTDVKKLHSTYLGLAALRAFWELGGQEFEWRKPPYEYNYELLAIEVLMGRKGIVDELTASNFDLKAETWRRGHKAYIKAVQPHLLYPRNMRSV